jgi:hypothetical protein
MSPISTLTLLTRSGAIVGGLQAFSAATNGILSPTPYGKFANLDQSISKVSGRTNMMLIYTPAFSFALYKVLELGGLPKCFDDREAITACALLSHFAKRIIETLCVHKYSSRVNPVLGGFIGIYYALVCGIILGFQSAVSADEYLPGCLAAGAILFLIGEVGNFVHHVYLAALRPKEVDAGDVAAVRKSYKVPREGLFSKVVCPHYSFELCAWLGIAVMSQEIHTYLAFLSMATYLGGRSVAQRLWAVENIPGFPPNRNCLLPGIF